MRTSPFPVLLAHPLPPVVIINEADSLTRDAQAALRRTMEKYMNNMRIILCASSTSKIIAPIKSRCLLVRVAAPTEDEVRPPGTASQPSADDCRQMLKVMNHVAKKEKLHLPEDTARGIMDEANGNMRKALLGFEALRMQR